VISGEANSLSLFRKGRGEEETALATKTKMPGTKPGMMSLNWL
jgi:hypothetical protein